MLLRRLCAATAFAAALALTLPACSAPDGHASAGPPGGQPHPTLFPRTPKPTPVKKRKPAIVQVKQTRVTAHGPGGSLMGTGSSAVALTFDDGPDPVNTPKILDLLKRYHVKATFCLVGTNVRAYPAIVRRIVAEGHAICDHTWHHRMDLASQPIDVIRRDLTATRDAIRAAAPKAKVEYFRAPGGIFSPRIVRIATSLGMRSLYWAVDPRDWDAARYGHGTSMVNHVVGAVEVHVRPGAVVLSHDYKKPDTITAYATLLPWLRTRYKLIPMPT